MAFRPGPRVNFFLSALEVCCGLFTISGFGEAKPEKANRDILDVIFSGDEDEIECFDFDSDFDPDEDFANMCALVVLTDEQMARFSRPNGIQTTWKDVLLQRGFSHVYRFENPSTGNVCNIFLRSDASLPLEG